MKREKTVYRCDSCTDDIRDGFIIHGCIGSIERGESGKEIISQTEETHYCRSCFKAIVGFKERVSVTTKAAEVVCE